MSPQDPYAKYGGKTEQAQAEDPYAKYGGAVATDAPTPPASTPDTQSPSSATTPTNAWAGLITPEHLGRAASSFGSTLAALPGQAWNIATDPANLLLPGAGGMVNQMMVQPAIHEAKESSKAASEGRYSEAFGHGLATAVPGVGPFAAHIGEQIGTGKTPEAIGELGAAALVGKGMDMVPGGIKRVGSTLDILSDARTFGGVVDATTGKLIPTPSQANIYNLAAVSKAPTTQIVEVQPFLKEAAQIYKLDPNLIETKYTPNKLELINDLERGLPKPQYDKFIRALGKDPAKAGPAPIELASAGVRLSNRPFEMAFSDTLYGKYPARDLQINMEGQLRDAAAKSIDPGVAKAYELLADKVKEEGSTWAGMNSVKSWALKESDRFYNLTPGGQINAQAAPLIAYVDTARKISRDLYPRVKDASKGKLDLADAGRKEAQAIEFRDNLYQNWNKAATANAAEIAARQNMTLGQRAMAQVNKVNPLRVLRPSPVGIAQQAGNLATQANALPLEQFNTLFKNGLGGVEGWVPGTKLPVELLSQPPSTLRALPPAPGEALGPPYPAPTAIPGQPPIGQGAQVRGVEPPVAGQLPMQPSRLDFGSGRVPVTPNQQLAGTAETPPLRKPAGPGVLLTRDPKVLASTLNAIDQMLQNRQLTPAYRAELMDARAKLQAQSQLPPPPK